MDDTKERILAAALDLFSVKGFAAVCTKGIAERADVNEVTLFRQFGSKRNLYIEVFNRFSVTPSEAFILSDIGGDFAEDLRSIGRSIASLFLRNGKIVRMSIKDLESFPEINTQLKKQPEALVSLVAGYFCRAAEKRSLNGDPAKLARIFVTSLMGTVLHLQRFSEEQAIYEFVDEFVDALYRGMRAPS